MKECDWQQIDGKPGHFWCPNCERPYGGPKGQRRAKFLCERLAFRLCVLPGEERAPRPAPPNVGIFPSKAKKEPRSTCRYLGEPIGTEECDTCRGKTRIKVFACALHNSCTLGKSLPGHACCAQGACKDYQAIPAQSGASEGTDERDQSAAATGGSGGGAQAAD